MKKLIVSGLLISLLSMACSLAVGDSPSSLVENGTERRVVESTFEPGTEVIFSETDENRAFETLIRETISIAEGPVYVEDVAGIYRLEHDGKDAESKITDLTGIQYLSGLKDLYLTNHSISDISILSELPQLRKLCLTGNMVSDGSPISSLTNLVYLGMGYNQLAEIPDLSLQSNIGYLDLSYNDIEIFDGSLLPSNLENLNIRSNNITTLFGVDHLDKMHTLILASNIGLSDISSLEQSASLKNLNILYTGIKDMSTLTRLPVLENLDLRYIDGIFNISFLAQIESLQTILYNRDQLTDLEYQSMINLSTVQINDGRSGGNRAPINIYDSRAANGRFDVDIAFKQQGFYIYKTSDIRIIIANPDLSGRMRFSNDNVTWTNWESYSSYRQWELTPGIGMKTVYAQYKDDLGNIFEAERTIELVEVEIYEYRHEITSGSGTYTVPDSLPIKDSTRINRLILIGSGGDGGHGANAIATASGGGGGGGASGSVVDYDGFLEPGESYSYIIGGTVPGYGLSRFGDISASGGWRGEDANPQGNMKIGGNGGLASDSRGRNGSRGGDGAVGYWKEIWAWNGWFHYWVRNDWISPAPGHGGDPGRTGYGYGDGGQGGRGGDDGVTDFGGKPGYEGRSGAAIIIITGTRLYIEE